MGAFDEVRTHNLDITSQTCNPLRHGVLYVVGQGYLFGI